MKQLLTLTAILFLHIMAGAQTAETLYEEGVKLKKEQKIHEAIAKFKEAIKLKPDYTEALYESGWCYNDVKEYANAITNLSKAALVWTTTPRVFFERGYANQMLSKYKEALDDYFRARELKPDYTNVNKKIGEVYYLSEDYPNAILYFEKHESISSTDLLGKDYLYWYRRGFSYNAQKQYEKAVTSLDKSLAIKKDYLSTYLELGFAYNKLKRADEAIAQYQKAIDLNPNDHVAYNGIGEVYRDNIKDCNKAIEWYNKTLRVKTNERKANFGIGYCLNSSGKYAEAQPYLKAAIASEPTYTAAYIDLGYSEYMLNNYTEALVQLNKALDLNESSTNALYYKGLVYIAKKDKQTALTVYEKLYSVATATAEKLKERIDKM
jgi:tetratricopeptide (TPR) repeat protein